MIHNVRYIIWFSNSPILSTLHILQYWYPVNPGYLSHFNHESPFLKLVLMLSLATNNPLNICRISFKSHKMIW